MGICRWGQQTLHLRRPWTPQVWWRVVLWEPIWLGHIASEWWTFRQRAFKLWNRHLRQHFEFSPLRELNHLLWHLESVDVQHDGRYNTSYRSRLLINDGRHRKLLLPQSHTCCYYRRLSFGKRVRGGTSIEWERENSWACIRRWGVLRTSLASAWIRGRRWRPRFILELRQWKRGGDRSCRGPTEYRGERVPSLLLWTRKREEAQD